MYVVIAHKKMYHGTLAMYHGALPMYHGTFSYERMFFSDGVDNKDDWGGFR